MLFDDRAVDASLKAVGPGALTGCTCFWDEHGNPPSDCRCSERAWADAREDRGKALTAAVAALDRDALVEKAARELAAEFDYAWTEDDDTNAMDCCWTASFWKSIAEKQLVAIGLIPEAPKEGHDA